MVFFSSLSLYLSEVTPFDLQILSEKMAVQSSKMIFSNNCFCFFVLSKRQWEYMSKNLFVGRMGWPVVNAKIKKGKKELP